MDDASLSDKNVGAIMSIGSLGVEGALPQPVMTVDMLEEIGGAQHPVSTFIVNRILRGRNVSLTCARQSVILSSTLGSIVIGGLSGVSYFQMARNFAGDAVAFGWILAICTLIGEGSISIWAQLSLIDKLYPLSKEEKKILANALPHRKKYLVEIVLTVLTLIPNTYATFKYNNGALLNAILLATLTFVNDAGLRLYSIDEAATNIYNFLDKNVCYRFSSHKNYTKFGFILEDIRQNFSKVIVSSCDIIKKYEHKLNDDGDWQFFLNQLYQLTKRHSDLEIRKKHCMNIYPRRAIIGFGFSFPTAVLAYQAILTYEFGRNLFGSGAFGIILSLVVTLMLAYIEYSVIAKRIGSIYDNTVGRLYGVERRSLAETAYPAQTMVLSVVAFLIGCFTFGPRGYITRETIGGVPGLIALIFAIIGTIIFQGNALVENVSRGIESYSKVGSNQDIKQLIHKIENLLKLNELVQKCTLDEFASLLLAIDDQELWENVTTEKISREELISFIDTDREDVHLGSTYGENTGSGYSPAMFLRVPDRSSVRRRDGQTLIQEARVENEFSDLSLSPAGYQRHK